MLVDKEVEITLNNKIIKYYESLGYEIPRVKNKWGKYSTPRGSKILVKTKDLLPKSMVEVNIVCDYCEKEAKVRFQDYYNHVHENGETYCNRCSNTIFTSGKDNGRYRQDKTNEERQEDRSTQEYSLFIKRVLERDNYTCQCCNNKLSGNAVVHHLDGYNWCIEKRTDETNGVTLCETCHNNFHLIYGKGNNTKEQFEEWFGETVELLKCEKEIVTARKIKDLTNGKVYDNSKVCASELGVKTIVQIHNVCNKKQISQKYERKDGTIKTYTYYQRHVKGHKLMWLDEYLKTKEK